MSRSLSTPTTNAAASTVTRPGYLVEIAFDSFVRLCSRATLYILGNEWVGWDVQVSGLASDVGKPAVSGSLTLGDADQSISALALAQGLAGRAVRVWRFFADAVADDDPVLVFDGVAGAVSGGMSREISVQLVAREATVLYSPRRRMTEEVGFHALPAAGQVFSFNGEKYLLEPER